MILNKFSPFSFARMRSLAFQLLALSLFSCNKTANINANKSYLSLTHLAYGVGPVTLELDNKSVFASPILFGETTGDTLLGPYDTVNTGVRYLTLFQSADSLFTGFFPFQLGVHYSMFFYDSLDQRSAKLLVVQSNPSVRTDTFTNVRYFNFTPGTYLGLKFVNTRTDTTYIPRYISDTVLFAFQPFVGYNVNPGYYQFNLLRIGTYHVYAFADSVNPRIDLVNPQFDSANFKNLGQFDIDSTINYDIFLQGFAGQDSGLNKFQLRYTKLN